MPQRESAIVQECLYALAHHGFFTVNSAFRQWPQVDPKRYVGIVWRSNTGAAMFGRSFVRFGVPGLPDITGWMFADGRRVAIECKTDTGRMNEDQAEHLSLATKTGCLAFVARSYQDVEDNLKKQGITRVN